MVIFQHMGSGTNVQWVFVVQVEEDTQTYDSVPTHFSTILNAVNWEMIERPALFEPAVVAEKWESTKVTCRLAGKERVLKVISVIGAGVDGFVYNPPHVRTPVAQRSNKKTTTHRFIKNFLQHPLHHLKWRNTGMRGKGRLGRRYMQQQTSSLLGPC